MRNSFRIIELFTVVYFYKIVAKIKIKYRTELSYQMAFDILSNCFFGIGGIIFKVFYYH